MRVDFRPLIERGSHLLVVHGQLAGIAQVHVQGVLLPEGLLVDSFLCFQLLPHRLQTRWRVSTGDDSAFEMVPTYSSSRRWRFDRE